MRASQYKHRITIKGYEEYRNEVGETTRKWVDFKTVWCAIKTMKGTEYPQAVATLTENTYRFIIRYTEGILPSMKVEYQGRTFDIVSALNDDELKKTITIIARERV